MPLKLFAFAATAESQRGLFQAPLAARQQAFLRPYQPVLVSPVASTAAAVPPAVVWTELAYSPENVEIPEDAWSPAWFGFGVVAAAAVAGAATQRAPTKKSKRGTFVDQLTAGVMDLEQVDSRFSAGIASQDNTFAMFSVGGQEAAFDGVAYAETLPGITGEGVWDPMNYCKQRGVTEGKIKFYREVELKHGRLAMLASVGLVVGENYHPLFGGDIDVPSYLAFQQTPLEAFWPAVVLAIAIPEIFSVMSFEAVPGGQSWSIRSDHESGNLGFDPLDMKPTDPDELREVQNKELTYGRFAMLGTAGMILQEVMTGSKLF
jgi:hypothetical protein